MANNKYAENLFINSGAVLEGHFQLTSGLHSPIYWEKFRILEYPEYTSSLCQMIASNFSNDDVELVIGPTTGGIIISHEVARYLGTKGIFAEKIPDGSRTLKRGFTIKPGQRVLLVDDVLTTGKSIIEVVDVIKRASGNLIGIGVLVDRSQKPLDVNVPLYSCIRSETVTYKPEECPLCAQGIPLVKLGSSNA